MKTFTQFSLGYAILFIVLISVFGVSLIKINQIKSIENRIMTLRVPTVNASNALKKNVISVLANLRGWMLLEDQSFINNRRIDWRNIHNNHNSLHQLSGRWEHPEHVELLKELDMLLEKFESSQNTVEFYAWREENLPATQLLIKDANPLAEKIISKVTNMINENEYLKLSETNKESFTAMANFRGSFAAGASYINAFLVAKDNDVFEKYKDAMSINQQALDILKKNYKSLSKKQKINFNILNQLRTQFLPIADEIFFLRQQETWNIASHELKTTAAPLGEKILALLSDMTEHQQHLLEVDSDIIKNHVEEFISFMTWFCFFAIIFSIIVFIYMRIKVSNPLNTAIKTAIQLSDQVGQGNYSLSQLMINKNASSSYETKLLLQSISTMMVNVEEQEQRLNLAKEQAEKDAEQLRISQAELAAQKAAIDEHSLVSITDIKGNIIYANDKFCNISGYSKEELIGKNHRLLNSDNQPKDYWRQMYLTVSKGNFWHDEVRNKAKDGHYYWVDTTIVPLFTEGKLTGYSSIRTDITHQKNTEKELIKSKERAEKDAELLRISQAELAAQKSAVDEHSLVSITDLKGNILYANDKFCKISGYTKEDLIGKNHRLLNSDNQPKDYWRKMYLTVSKGNFWHDEVRNKAKDGHYYWVDTTIVPLFTKGKLTGYSSIRTDITHQKNTELELITAKKHAESANEAKTNF